MTYYVLVFSSYWADEFEVKSFSVVREDKFKDLKQKTDQALSNVIDQHGWYRVWFGTNESLEFPTADNYWNSITAKEITEQEAKTFHSTLGEGKFEDNTKNRVLLKFGTVDFFPLEDYSDNI